MLKQMMYVVGTECTALRILIMEAVWKAVSWFVWSYYISPLNPLKPSGYYMYHQFNIQQFYVLPTQCIYVFCVDLRTNSDYFTVQH
jgi:hypothetical protein